MEVAQSIATNVGQSAVNDALSLQKLESMGYGLLKELDYVEKLAEASFTNEADRTATMALKDDEFQGHDEAIYEPTTETNDDLHVSQTKIVVTKDDVEIYPESKTELWPDSNEMSSLGDLNMKLTSNENIVKDLENASKNVVDEMQIVENTAKSVANNALEDARAISSLRTETNEVVDSIRSFQTTIEEATMNPSLELGDLVKTTGSKTLDLIKIDEENAEMISEVVTKDAQLDEIAANSIGRADKEIDDLINAAASMIDETASDSSLVNSFEDLNNSISESIKVLNQEVEHCSNCARIEDVSLIEEVIGSALNMEPNLSEQSIVSLSDSCTNGLDNVPVTELMHAVRTEELMTILSIFI
jgi:CRISPR/Cas system CSM-associated protein Csm2 small subunit